MSKCKSGHYYCYTDKKCKPISKGMKVTARFSGGGKEPEEVGIDKPLNGNDTNGNGNGNGGTNGGVSEGTLHKWFKGSKSKDGKGGWVNVVTGGTCASDEPGEGTPKCVSSAKRASMSKAERLSAQRRKKKADPGQQQKSGAAKPTYVSTDPKKKMKKEEVEVTEAKDKEGKGSGKKDACYHKVKANSKVWPSAYASGRLVQCRKKGADNWGNKTEETEINTITFQHFQEKCWKGSAGIEVEVVNEGIKKRLAAAGAAAAVAAAGGGAGAKAATHHSGSVNFSSKPVAAKATDKSVKSAVSKAIANPGTSHSASSEKGKRVNKVGVSYSMTHTPSKSEKTEKKKDRDKSEKKRSEKHGDPGKPSKPGKPSGKNPSRSKVRGNSGGSSDRAPEVRSTTSRTGGSTLTKGNTSSSTGGRTLFKFEYEPEGDVVQEKCWKGYEKKGTKKMFGKTYNNCVKKEETEIKEAPKYDKQGLDKFDRSKRMIRHKQDKYGVSTLKQRIMHGGVDHNIDNEKKAKKAEVKEGDGNPCWDTHKQVGMKKKNGRMVPNCVPKEEFSDWRSELDEGAAWTKKSGKNPSGGLNEKGRKSYERENPGSDLKAPSKKVGNKRRASFCARMKGMKKKLTSSKTANDPDSRINKSLRAWNC